MSPIQYKKRLASEEGGCSLTAWASPPSKVPARRSSAPAGVGGPLADLTDLASLPSIVRSDAAACLPLIVVIGIRSSSKEVVRCVTMHTVRRIHQTCNDSVTSWHLSQQASPTHIRTLRWRHSKIKILVSV